MPSDSSKPQQEVSKVSRDSSIENDNWNGMRILMILPLWDPTFQKKNIGKIIKAMLSQGAVITVFCEATSHITDLYKWVPQISVVSFSEGQSRLKAFRQLLRRHRFDLVLWTYSGYHENLVLAYYRLRGKLRYVIKSDSRLHYPLISLKSYISKYLYFLLPGLMADLILVETRNVEAAARQFYKTDRVYYYPNGVPVETFRAYEQAFMHDVPNAKPPYVLYTGRIFDEKGVDLLIKSFSLIVDRNPGWNLEIVGPVWDEEYDEYCRDLVVRNGLAERIHFHPAAFGQDLYHWYYFADIYALPSRREGLANRIPEAMFFKNPIIAFDVGQTKSLVTEDTGILVPPEDMNTFANGLSHLIQHNAERVQMGQAARRRIEGQYDDNVLIPNLLQRCRVLFSAK